MSDYCIVALFQTSGEIVELKQLCPPKTNSLEIVIKESKMS